MGYKLHPPGTRRNNAFYVVRGTVCGHRFEAITRTTDRGQAEKFAVEYIAELAKENGVEKPKTFCDAADAYIAFKKPRKLDLTAIVRLKTFFGPSRLLKDVGGADLVRAANALLPQGSNAHKNRTVITPGSSIMHYAAEEGWCGYSRHRRFKVSRKSNRKPASPGAVQKLLESTTGKKRLLIAWLYETGQRITDSVRLHDDQLDLLNAKAFMKSSKNDDGAWIDLSPELVAMLANEVREPGGYVFPWRSRHSVYRWLRPLVRELDITYTPHLSRHALATDLRALGWDLKAIAERGVWRDERSAARYVHHHATGTAGRSVGRVTGDAGHREMTEGDFMMGLVIPMRDVA
jgi:integrase